MPLSAPRVVMAAVAAVMALAAALLAPAPAHADDPVFDRAFGAGPADLCSTVCRAGSNGAGAGQLGTSYGAAVSGGEVYVADQSNHRISVYSTEGTFARAFGRSVNAGSGSPDLCTVATTCKAGVPGGTAGQLSSPYAVAISGGEVYVADASNNRVSVFSTGGVFLRAFGKGVNAGAGSPDVCTNVTTCRPGTNGSAAGQLSFPLGVAVAGGEVYVADSSNSRVNVYAADGTFARSFGAHGAAAGQLSFPFDVAAAGGAVYVADKNNQRVSQFATDGTFVRAFGKGVNPSLGDPDVCTTLTSCRAGTMGAAAGQLKNPLGVALAGGEVFVTDGNHRVNVFAADGTFARAFGGGVNAGAGTPDACTVATGCQVSTAGGASGQLNNPAGLAIAGSVVYVADTSNFRVGVYGTDGTFARAFGKGVWAAAPFVCTTATGCGAGAAGGGAAQLNLPQGLAVSGGEVYVADHTNHRVSVYAANGTFARAFGKGVNAGAGDPDVCTTLTTCRTGTPGAAAGQLAAPAAVAVSGGEVYVAEQNNQRVSVFAVDGTFARAFGKAVNAGTGSPDVCTAATTCRFGTQGAASGQLNTPFGLAVAGGEVYVADSMNHRVSVFGTAGTFARAFGKGVNAGFGNPDVCTTSCRAGTQGGAAGQLSFPFGLAVGSGAVYVAERFNARISVHGTDGIFARAFGKLVNAGSGAPDVCTTSCRAAANGDAAGQFTEPASVALSGIDVYVSDRLAHRVSVFRVPRTEAASDRDAIAFGARDIDEGPAATQTATIRNSGTEPVSIATLTLAGATTQFARLTGAGGDCTNATVLQPGESCQVRLQFDPTTTGPKAATLTIGSNAPAIAIGLTGTGIQTEITPTPSALAFGARDVDDGPTAVQTSTIANTGSQTVAFTGLTLAGDATQFERLTGAGTDCTGTTVLAAGQTCTVRFRFDPTTPGAKAMSVTVSSNAPVTAVALGGTGTQTELSRTAGALAFGPRDIDDGPAPTQSSTILNTGTEPVTLAAPALTGHTTEFERLTGLAGDCAAATVLQAGDACTVRVRFDPTTTGSKAATLTLASNAPAIVIALTGSGRQTQLTQAPATLAFGARDVDTGSTTSQTSTITNTGTETVALSALTLSGDSEEFELLTGGVGECTDTTVLQPGESCALRVMFDPAAPGLKAATLEIASNAPPVGVALTGRGVQIELAHGPAALSFGSRDINTGASADHAATITNTGGEPISFTGLTLSGDATQFVRVTGAASDCSTADRLEADEQCTLRMRFDPSSTGAKTAILTVASNAPPIAIALNGSGTLTQLSADPGSLEFGWRDLDEEPGEQSVRIANTGTESVTVGELSLSGDSAHFERHTGAQGDCAPGARLAIGETCRLRVRFDPVRTGRKTATVTIASNAPAALTVDLAGTGTTTLPDFDGDGLPDDRDPDDDDDGVPDELDGFPYDKTRQAAAPVRPAAQAAPKRWRLVRVGRVRVVGRDGVTRVATGYEAVCPAGRARCTGRLTLKLRRRSDRTGKVIPIFLTGKSRPVTIAAGERRRISLALSESGRALLRRHGVLNAVLRGSVRTGDRPAVARRATLRLSDRAA